MSCKYTVQSNNGTVKILVSKKEEMNMYPLIKIK